MAWKKSSAELIAAYDSALPGDPRVERRKMFGFDCAFANGHMFSGLFEQQLHVRLPEPARERALALPGARTFAPMAGRPMREYVSLPAAVIAEPAQLRDWLAQGFEHACSLPPKAPRTPKAKAVQPEAGRRR